MKKHDPKQQEHEKSYYTEKDGKPATLFAEGKEYQVVDFPNEAHTSIIKFSKDYKEYQAEFLIRKFDIKLPEFDRQVMLKERTWGSLNYLENQKIQVKAEIKALEETLNFLKRSIQETLSGRDDPVRKAVVACLGKIYADLFKRKRGWEGWLKSVEEDEAKRK